MRDPVDWLVYVTPKLARPSDGELRMFDPLEGYTYPRFYPTSAAYLWNHVRPRDRIWMLGVLRIAGATLPPAIDGMMVVKNTWKAAERRPPAGPGSLMGCRRYWFEPEETGSAWYPWKDASQELSCIRLLTKDNATKRLPDLQGCAANCQQGWKRWGNFIRPGRKIAPDSVQLLSQHVSRLNQRSVFISYSWTDGAKLAAALAQQLSERGYSVWLDRFSAPRQLSLGLARANRDNLGPFLSAALMDCAAFIQIRTPEILRKEQEIPATGWCALELRVSQENGKPGSEIDLPAPRGLRRGGFTPADREYLAHLVRELETAMPIS